MPLNRGTLALTLTACIWGVALVITKALLQEAGPFTISVLRFLLAWILLVPFAYRQGYRLAMVFRPTLVFFGLTGVTLYFGLLNGGLVFTGAGSAALIQAGAPAIMTFLSVLFLKERVARLQLLGIGLSVVGLLLVTGNSMQQGGSAPVLGNLLVVGSVIAWAIYTIQSKHLSSVYPWLVVTTASIGVGVICLTPFALGELWWQGLPHLHGNGLMQLLYLGGVSSALGYGLWNYGLRFTDASQAAPYFNLIPIVGLLLSVLVLHESPTLIQVGGGVFTLLGVYFSNQGPSHPATRGEQQQKPPATSGERRGGGERECSDGERGGRIRR